VTTRQARVYVTRIDPWSAAKVAFLLSLAIAVIMIVAVAALWWVLDYTDVFITLSRTVNEVFGGAATNFDLVALLDFSRVMGVTVVLASVEIVLVSILATLFAVLYNLSVGLTGGVEVDLSDDA
jgi:Transmembrane domain of unknown function (DUF3566)